MAKVIEDIEGKIRNLPISPKLKRILMAAGQLSGVDTVRVTSGGQCAKGTCARRTGSTRHDLGNAADLMLEIGGQPQDFTTASGQKVFEDFAEFSAAMGCTGLGAGIGYMGKFKMHVGFGNKAVWAKKGQPALSWLVRAVHRGWRNPIDINTVLPQPGVDLTGLGRFFVNTQSRLNLRGGPGINFQILGHLDSGTELDVIDRNGRWAKVDLSFDGTPDGFVHGAFLKPA